MSPIIYTRHHCNPDEDPAVIAMAEDPEVIAMDRTNVLRVLWQCPDCQAYWRTEATRTHIGKVVSFVWSCIGRPKETAILREVENSLNGSAGETLKRINDG